MKPIPKVGKYMTTVPKSIGYDRPISQAMDLMRELRIRHLPVLRAGKVIGLVSDRDIKLVTSFEKVDPTKISVAEACSYDPYTTSPESSLNEVVTHMAEKKYGSAVVVDNDKLVGILTETDIYRAFAELLETRLR